MLYILYAFLDENFIVIYMDLLQAGSDTNSAFLEAFFLFMVLYPDVQEKIVAEINQFGGDITVANREKYELFDKNMLKA